MDELFYLTSRHGDCDDDLMLHGIEGNGYVTDLSKAHKFTLEEAQKELDHDINSLPLLVDAVDAIGIQAVDCQYIKEPKRKDPNGEYVVQVDRTWNGNDIAFIKKYGETFDYREAEVFTYDEAMMHFAGTRNVILSKAYMDSLSRPVMWRSLVSTRKMITGAGIKYKKPRKKKEGTGKTRMNCPSCGRLHWQHNPYDFDGCDNTSCKEWKPLTWTGNNRHD